MYAAEWEPEHAEFQKWDNWAKWVLFLLLGLSLTGRSFAYLGIPPAKLFVGDLTLAAFIVLHPRNIFDPWIVALTKGGPLGPVAWLLLASLGYGIFEVIRGILRGFTPLVATENLVFNIYPIYLFPGDMVGTKAAGTLIAICPGLLPLLLRIRSGLHALPEQVDGNDAGIGWSPYLWPAIGWRRHYPGAALPRSQTGSLLGPHDDSRSDVACRTSPRGMGGHGPRAVDLGYLVKKDDPGGHDRRRYRDPPGDRFSVRYRSPSAPGTGGNISSREIVARGVAAIDPALAEDLTASTNMSFYNGTITWRENWWHAIWANSQANYTNLLIGPGYGFLLKEPGELPQGFRRPANTT